MSILANEEAQTTMTPIEIELALYGYDVGQIVAIDRAEGKEFEVVAKRDGQIVLEPRSVPMSWITFDKESGDILYTMIEDGKIVTKTESQ